MTVRPEHPANHPFPLSGSGPLPPGFEPELREIDDLLRRQASLAQTPPNLAESVYRVSVSGLPRPAARPARPPVVHVVRRRLLGRFSTTDQWWGRVAMAASLGLAFLLAALFMRGPAIGPGDRATSYEVVFAHAEDVLEADHLDEFDREVSYILDTGGWSSSDEVTGELEAIIAAF